MKKLALMLTLAMTLLLFAVTSAAGAAETQDTIPEDVLEYAGGAGMRSIKSFMKDPKNNYIGSLFSSVEEIDALELGEGYRLFEWGNDPYKWKDTLRGSGAYADRWMFSLDDGEGPAALFFVERDDGGFSFSGASSAESFCKAMTLISSIADKEGADFDPIVAKPGTGLIIAQDFNGTEGLVTIAGDVFPLDSEYLKVRKSSELPTFAEYKAEVIKNLVPASEYVLSSITGGEGLTLKPHVAGAGNAIVIAAAAAAGAAVIALALIGFIKHAKKTAE